MSYELTISGFDPKVGLFSSYGMFEDVGLKSALESLGAKTVNYGGLGSFIQDVGGMKYQEKDNGIYTWLLSKQTPTGAESVDYGIDQISPNDGDHYFAQYEFIPNSNLKPVQGYTVPDIPIPDEIEFPEYEFSNSSNYFEPEIFSYDELSKKENDERPVTEIEISNAKEYSPYTIEYTVFEMTCESSAPQLTSVVFKEKQSLRRHLPDLWSETDFGLESFINEVLISARLSKVFGRKRIKEPLSPLILA